jgi:hypothetical protein
MLKTVRDRHLMERPRGLRRRVVNYATNPPLIDN